MYIYIQTRIIWRNSFTLQSSCQTTSIAVPQTQKLWSSLEEKRKKNEKKRRAIFIDDKAFDDRHCILCCCPYVHGQKIQLDPNDRMRTGEGAIGQDMDE